MELENCHLVCNNCHRQGLSVDAEISRQKYAYYRDVYTR